ncbi:response regulator [Methanobacterium petrolearium]|uniref:response regulator n=1 Tax=Methanobacterium petrolearium TaxID=710190 RepID=UPI001AE96C8E|nr:response regulator [Methanobacterium petrolearium]MBP1946584.1 PAS domain S-box-containing protein [Methanobacterium petrolearium]BDZ69932.1 hypothetical protein GCM10025861_04490 [Methanobacterium petrolearium]
MPKRILVVEDEEILRMGTTLNLKSFGYNVVGNFKSGEDAIEHIENLNPDLVLMDIKLSGDLNGIETVKRIQEKIDIPVIYLSVYSDQETIEKAKFTKPFRYMNKPFNDEELKFTIETAIKSHTQKKLCDKLKTHKDVINNIQGTVYRFYLDRGEIELFNGMSEKMTGFKPSELKNYNLHFLENLILSEDQKNVENILSNSINLKIPFSMFYRIKNKKGQIKKFYEIGKPVTGSQGEVLYLDGIIFDVTT